MEIKTTNSEDAKRLELTLDDASRTGNKMISTEINNLEQVLDNDDISITSISLHRNTSSQEAEIIDSLLTQTTSNGKFERKYFHFSEYGGGQIKVKDKTVFELAENSVQIKDNFQKVVNDEIEDYENMINEDSYADAIEDARKYTQSQIEDLKGRIEILKDSRDELTHILVDEVIDNDGFDL